MASSFRSLVSPTATSLFGRLVTGDSRPDGTGERNYSPLRPPSSLDRDKAAHLLLLGIDRRSWEEGSYRTDTIILLSFSPERSRAVVTSIPRDLWMGGAKINADFVTGGFELLAEHVWEVTGMMPSSYVAVDFDAAVWAIDALGGLPVDIQRSFSDSSYPDDRSGGDGSPMTISFEAGTQSLDGEEALRLARSRKGDSGEGSDFQRMRRQQQILKALPERFLSPGHIFYPFELEEFYDIVTTHIETNLSVSDVGTLYELLKSYKNVHLEFVVLDNQNFLFSPPAAIYGGASVVRPLNEDFEAIHDYLQNLLEEPSSEES